MRDADEAELPVPGVIFVASPDASLLVELRRMRLSRGPKVNPTPPALAPLVSDLCHCPRARAMGVTLSGRLGGTSGLQDIKRCGGVPIVQDPGTAEAADMATSALDNVPADYCIPADTVGQVLAQIVAAPPASGAPPWDVLARLRREQDASEGRVSMSLVRSDAEPTLQICPDCGGALWLVKGSRPSRFACHTGHTLSLRALADALLAESEHVLRGAVRVLRERSFRLRQVQAHEQDRGSVAAALWAGRHADTPQQSDSLAQLVEQGQRPE